MSINVAHQQYGSACLLQIPVNPWRATLRYRGDMNEDDFSQLPPAAQAYIRELETRNRQLGERITQLEEQFRLAQSKRFAPSSEKLKDRVFDEAEQIDSTESDDMEVGPTDDAFMLPDTGLPDPPAPTRGKPGRKPLPAHLPRQRIEYDLSESEKVSPFGVMAPGVFAVMTPLETSNWRVRTGIKVA